MRSPANLHVDFDSEEERQFPVRTAIEWVLRVIGLVALVFLIWQAIHLLNEKISGRAEGETVRESLVRWSTQETPHDIHAVLDSIPSPELRDWLASFPATQTAMSWEGVSLKPSAVSVEPIADPRKAVRVWVAAPNEGQVAVSDSMGLIDSVAITSGGAVLNLHHLDGPVTATIDGTAATAALRDSLKVKPVLILGIASWEGKFIMASLEEHGWKVDARFQVSPKGKGVVVQGPAEPRIDTANYGTVIVLDSSAAKYAGALANFARNQGGGVIVTGYAAPLNAFQGIMPGNATMPSILSEEIAARDSSFARSVLKIAKITGLHSSAIPIEKRKDDVTVAAWVLGKGKVMQVGYLDTWKWRLGGIEQDPNAEYTLWWSRMVSGVTYAPRYDVQVVNEVEPTPMASLVGILGKPETKEAKAAGILNDPRLLPFLFGLVMAAFLLEWASRRLRGRP